MTVCGCSKAGFVWGKVASVRQRTAGGGQSEKDAVSRDGVRRSMSSEGRPPPSHWLLPETERVSVPPARHNCCCSAPVLLTAAALALLPLILTVMNAVAPQAQQQHLFTWDHKNENQEEEEEEEEEEEGGGFVHTAVHGRDEVLQLFCGESDRVRSYLETILESGDDEEDEEYASCPWTDSDRGTVVEVTLDQGNDDNDGDDDESSTDCDDDDGSNYADAPPSPAVWTNQNNDGCHGNTHALSCTETEVEGNETGENVMEEEEEAADARLRRLMQRNSQRETRLWLRANFARPLAPSGGDKKKEEEEEGEGKEQRERWRRSLCRSRSCPAGSEGAAGRTRPKGPRRASWPPEAAMQQPVCVRVTAAEIAASSPCFALKLTPPPPRRRPHVAAGERPSILKTPSPTPPAPVHVYQQATIPTPPPRRRHFSASAQPPPLSSPVVVVATPVTLPDTPPMSPDAPPDPWTVATPDLSFDALSSADVSLDVPMSPDVSLDLPVSPDIMVDYSELHTVPYDDHSVRDVFTFNWSSSSRKPPLPPVRPPLVSAKMTSGVKSRIASARRQYLEQQQQQQRRENLQQQPQQSLLQDRFQRFCSDTRMDRARLAASVPDLEEMRRSPSPAAIDRPHAEQETPSRQEQRQPTYHHHRVRSQERPWPAPPAAGRVSKSLGILETDLDSDEPRTREVTDLDSLLLLNRTSSLMALRESRSTADDRARSMDFLLDDDNRASALPPENALTGRVKSEHELRVERSLQNLTLPDWYKRKPQEGFLLNRRGNETGRPASQPLRWSGLGSRTPSATSLAPLPLTVLPKRPASRPEWRHVSSLRSSRESLQSSTASPDSTSSSPFFSWTAYRAGRTQPYLGWRHATSVAGSSACSTPLSGSRPVSPGRWWLPGSGRASTPQEGGGDLKNDPGNFRSAMSRDRYSYIQSIYNGDAPKFTNTTGNSPAKATPTRSPVEDRKDEDEDGDEEEEEEEEEKSSGSVFWMESSFVGSRSTTSVVVLPDDEDEEDHGTPLRRDSGAPIDDHSQQQQQTYSKRGSKGNCGGDLSRSSTSERLGEYFSRFGLTL